MNFISNDDMNIRVLEPQLERTFKLAQFCWLLMELPWLSACENSPCCLFLCQLRIPNLGTTQITQQAAHEWVNPIISGAGNGSGKLSWFSVYWQICFTHWVSVHPAMKYNGFVWQFGKEVKLRLDYIMQWPSPMYRTLNPLQFFQRQQCVSHLSVNFLPFDDLS